MTPVERELRNASVDVRGVEFVPLGLAISLLVQPEQDDITALSVLMHDLRIECFYEDVAQEVLENGPRDCSPQMHVRSATKLLETGRVLLAGRP